MASPADNSCTPGWPLTDPDGFARVVAAIGPKLMPEEPCPRVLEDFWGKYETPMLQHLRARFAGYPRIREHLTDILVAFTRDKILVDGYLLKMWEPRKGRFRHYLRSSLTRYVWDWWKRQTEYAEWEGRLKEPWKEHRLFAALDRSGNGYDAVIVNRTGRTEIQFHFSDSRKGWQEFERKMLKFGSCPIGLGNTCSAPVPLLKSDYDVYQADPESGPRPEVTFLAQAFSKGGYNWWSLRQHASDHAWRDGESKEPPSVPIEPCDGEEIEMMRAVIAITMERVERACKDNRPQPRGTQMWEVFRLKDLEPVLSNADRPTSRELAQRFNVEPFQIDNMSFDANEMFRAELSSVISEYEAAGKATGSELRPLRARLGQL